MLVIVFVVVVFVFAFDVLFFAELFVIVATYALLFTPAH